MTVMKMEGGILLKHTATEIQIVRSGSKTRHTSEGTGVKAKCLYVLSWSWYSKEQNCHSGRHWSLGLGGHHAHPLQCAKGTLFIDTPKKGASKLKEKEGVWAAAIHQPAWEHFKILIRKCWKDWSTLQF